MDLEAFAEALESIRTDQWGPYRTEILAALRRSARPEVAGKSIEERQDAAEAFVQDMVKREKFDFPAENALSWGYLWHGWALRDAFQAGVDFALTPRPQGDG